MPSLLDAVALDSSTIQMHCNGCALARSCLPAAVPDEEMELLQTWIRHTRPMPARSQVFRVGEPFDGAYVVRTGVVKTYRTDADGQEQIVGFHFPGESFGLESLGLATHTTSAVVVQSAALCLVPLARVFSLTTMPATTAHVLQLLADRISDQQEHIIRLSQYTAQERVAAFLLDLSLRYRRCRMSHTWMRVPMSRGEISNYLGLVIETVSRVLMRFQRLGLIRLANRDLELLDIGQLRELARLPPVDAVTRDSPPVAQALHVERIVRLPAHAPAARVRAAV